jgi:hypothetical protein
MKLIFTLVAASVLSTLTMDIAGGFLRSAGMTAGVPAGLTGKWVESSINGTVFLDDIRTSPGEPTSLQRFLFYHYIIGMLLTCTLYVITTMLKTNSIPWWLPMSYGLTTTVLPLFLMFPAMGFGPLGLKGPPEYLLFQTAILNHLGFGFGLTISFRWILKL